MDRENRVDAADLLAGIGRHWGWVLFGIQFRLRSLGQVAAHIAPAT